MIAGFIVLFDSDFGWFRGCSGCALVFCGCCLLVLGFSWEALFVLLYFSGLVLLLIPKSTVYLTAGYFGWFWFAFYFG